MEWLESVPTVALELGIIQEAFRMIGVGVSEVFFTTIKRPVVDREISLDFSSQQNKVNTKTHI